MVPSDDEIADAAAERLQRALEEEFPQLEVYVWHGNGYANTLSFRVRDPRSGRGKEFIKALEVALSPEVHARVAKTKIREWLAEKGLAHE
jgi:hypothetical protein